MWSEVSRWNQTWVDVVEELMYWAQRKRFFVHGFGETYVDLAEMIVCEPEFFFMLS